MTTLVFGTGVGTFILLAVWSAALLLCFISLRTNRNVGPVAVLAAVLVMVVLLLIPRGPEAPISTEHKIYDNLFIWRVLLAGFLGLSTFASVVAFITLVLMEPKQGQRIKSLEL
ncbi:transmembrane protein 218-like [Macrosteles quadrilineatus]|uniref:transmembrane protein 218-like n=1 Tax=Macrosteles quadrilineatus TaxID=74068 RepID=UPI0023E1781F|nr:transmembrane protein 218-like [Macrosteles quadrilineatus]